MVRVILSCSTAVSSAPSVFTSVRMRMLRMSWPTVNSICPLNGGKSSAAGVPEKRVTVLEVGLNRMRVP